jgi:hypothetical protein
MFYDLLAALNKHVFFSTTSMASRLDLSIFLGCLLLQLY